jgi:hypothetical protein
MRLTVTRQAAERPARWRSDAARVQFIERGMRGLPVTAEHCAVPRDLLSKAMGIGADRIMSGSSPVKPAGHALATASQRRTG